MIANSQQAPKARVFISYSRKDMAVADRLEAALKERGAGRLKSANRTFPLWPRKMDTPDGGRAALLSMSGGSDESYCDGGSYQFGRYSQMRKSLLIMQAQESTVLAGLGKSSVQRAPCAGCFLWPSQACSALVSWPALASA